MAASVDVVINAIDKTQGTLKGVGQGFKTIGATVAIATGMFYAANAALDNVEKRLTELDMTDHANKIGDAQQAWQALSDTILAIGFDSGIFDGLLNGLKRAGVAASQLLVIIQAWRVDLQEGLGIITKEEAAQDRMRIAQTYTAAQEKSAAAAAKEKTKELEKQNDALKKQQDQYDNLNEALINAMHSQSGEAIRKAQSNMIKFQNENPSMFAPNSNSVTVVINGGGMKDVVTDVIVNGTKQDPNYQDPTRGY